MPETKLYKKDDLLADLNAVGNRLPRKMPVYLIGGCAMSLKDMKEFTKDVDAIFTSIDELRLFEKELLSLGYKKSVSLDVVYEKLGAYSILRHPKNAGFDLFHVKVCNMLKLSDGMIKRSSKYGNFGNLKLFLISDEDITLFKGITERPRDIDDIAAIIQNSVQKGTTFDWDAVRSECEVQTEHLKIEGHLYERFHELLTKYQIRSPLMPWLRRRGIKNLLHEAYLTRVEKGLGHDDIIKEFVKEGFGRSDIRILESFGRKKR